MNHVKRDPGNNAGTQPRISLRKLSADEVDLLQRISRQTFFEAYGAGNDPEDLRLFLDTAYSRGQFAEELSNPDSAFWLLELDSLPAGYIMTRIKNADVSGTCLQGEISAAPGQLVPAKTIFELERIYVLADYQGRGYGKLLMGKAVAMAEEGGFSAMRLGVWKQNSMAVAFYQREGFRITGEKTFLVGNDEQQDWVMERDLP